MSESGNDTAASGAQAASQNFTEREMQMLAWAMQSLKSGPPDVSLPSSCHPLRFY